MSCGNARLLTRHPAGAWAAGLCVICSTLAGVPAYAADPVLQRAFPVTPTFAAPEPAAAAPEQAFSLTPTLGLRGDFTDNVGLTASDREADFITRALLGLDTQVNSARVTASAVGDVAYDAYARMPQFDGWSVRGNGVATLQLIRGTLLMEADGTVTNGNISTFDVAATDRAGTPGRVQLATYGVGPRLTTTLGDYADLAAAARFAQVYYWTADKQAEQNLPAEDNIVQVIGRVGTGARSGRFELLATGEFLRDDAGYSSVDAVQSVFVTIQPTIRLIARAGYERVSPSGIAPIAAPVLSAGLEFRPNAQSTISVEGGRRYDRTAWAAEADVQISPRVQLSGAYAETIQPDQVSVARSFREFVERSVMLEPASPLGDFRIEGNLYNETALYKSGELHATYSDPVNSLTFWGVWADRTFLRSGGRDRTFSGHAVFSRRLHPDLTLSVGADYARTYESQVYGKSESRTYFGRLAYKANSTTDFNANFARAESRQLLAGGAKITEYVISIGIRRAL